MRFAVMICTHGRPYKQLTLQTLRKSGYTGKIYLIVDNEDDTVSELSSVAETFNAEIKMFDKEYYFQTMDKGTIDNHRACILYAKGFCEDFAKSLGLDAFIIADDDMTGFRHRYCEGDVLKSTKIRNTLDEVIIAYVDFMLKLNLSTIGFGFVSCFYQGVNALNYEQMLKYRIPYNFIFRNCNHIVDWKSWFGEDVVTATYYNMIGQLWLTVPLVQQDILPISTAVGGMREIYADNSSVKLTMQNLKYLPSELSTYCHRGTFKATIQHDRAYPMLISGRYKK